MVDIIARQGKNKLKVDLSQMRKMDIFEEIEQPEVVYHMTDKDNLESILDSRRIKCFNDYATYFFMKPEQAPLYIELTGAKIGRQYYGTDGKIIKSPPLVIENTVVLKLIPKRKEKLEWFKEVVDETKDNYADIMTDDIKPLWTEFNNSRVLHYGDFCFDSQSVEIIELTDVYANLSESMQKTIDRIIEYKESLLRKGK